MNNTYSHVCIIPKSIYYYSFTIIVLHATAIQNKIIEHNVLQY